MSSKRLIPLTSAGLRDFEDYPIAVGVYLPRQGREKIKQTARFEKSGAIQDETQADLIGDEDTCSENDDEYGKHDQYSGEETPPHFMFSNFRKGTDSMVLYPLMTSHAEPVISHKAVSNEGILQEILVPSNNEIINPSTAEVWLGKQAILKIFVKLKKSDKRDNLLVNREANSGQKAVSCNATGSDVDADDCVVHAKVQWVAFETLQDESYALVMKPICRFKLNLSHLLQEGEAKVAKSDKGKSCDAVEKDSRDINKDKGDADAVKAVWPANWADDMIPSHMPILPNCEMTCRTRCGRGGLPMLLLVLSVLVLCLVPSTAQCEGAISEGEYQALYSLFNATNGTHWAWRNATETPGKPWVFNTSALQEGSRIRQGDSGVYLSDPCRQPWQGLVCDSRPLPGAQCCISEVNLPTYNLQGQLPQELANLPHLQYLHLNINSLEGLIPSSLGNLTLLLELYLQTNSLTGPIPSILGNLTNLEYLILYSNMLTGTVPSSLGNLSRLQYLDLFSNSLTGPIASSLGNLTHLEYLALPNNFLTSPIPLSLGSLTQLKFLGLQTNYITGPIPGSLENLAVLEGLNLYINCITGPIPSSLGNLALVELILNVNSLTGPIPSSLGNLPSLLELYLNVNSLTGPIPSSLGNLALLGYLILFSNSLTGPVPSSLGNLNRLQFLDLSSNSLTGPIPLPLGDLARLEYFSLNSNSLTGPIPSSVSSLQSLRSLYFNSNRLQSNLEVLAPTSEGTSLFPVLEELDVADNAFSGSFPPMLLLQPALSTFAASSNCFSGKLNISAGSKLKTLLLDGLSSGSACRNYIIQLPSQLVPNPGYIPVNYMAGSIPSAMWTFPHLQTLSLVGNGFTGTLDLGSFDPGNSRLQSVSLAYNFISGTVPAALQTYGQFQYFDISNNKFSGTLNADLAFNLTFAAAFNVSVNRLSGAFPAGQYDLLAVPSAISTVLVGNLFTFDASSLVGIALQDGSLQLNIAMVIAAVLPTLLALLWVGASWFPVRIALPDRLLYDWTSCAELSRYIQISRFLGVARTLVLTLLAVLLVVLALGLLLVLMKSDTSLRSQFSTYEFQYGWTFSAGYLHDWAPVTVCGLCLGVASLLLWTVFPVGRVASQSAASSASDEGSNETTKNVLNIVRRRVGFLFLWLVNGAVMLTFNGLYLSAVLKNTPYLILIQAALALFKFGWNQLTALFVITRVSRWKKQRSVDVLLLSLQVFNFVLAPCIATAVSDSNCFYELFSRQSAQAGSTRGECLFYEIEYVDGKNQFECADDTGSSSLAQPFNPPFVYHYQCSSALIVNYVPVLLYAFVFGSVGVPCVLLLCIRYRTAVVRWCTQPIVNSIFVRLYVFDECDCVGQHHCSAGDPSNGFECHQGAEGAVSTQKNPLFRGGLFMNQLMLHVLVLMTFGLAAPYLAFIIVLSFIAELMTTRLLVGRYLSICYHTGFPAAGVGREVAEMTSISQNNPLVSLFTHDKEANRYHLKEALLPSSTPDSDSMLRLSSNEALICKISPPTLDPPSVGSSSPLVAAGLREVDEALEGVWAYPYDGMWLVVLVAQLFWTLLFFDMIGDVYGYEAGLLAMVVSMLCLPLLTYGLVLTGQHYKSCCNFNMWRYVVSAAGAHKQAAESERSSELSSIEIRAEKIRSDMSSPSRDSETASVVICDTNLASSGFAKV